MNAIPTFDDLLDLLKFISLNNGKGVYIAKQIVSAKMRGQNILLEKYGPELHEEEKIIDKIEELDSHVLNHVQKKLNTIEEHFTKRYFNQIFRLLPEKLRPEKRSKLRPTMVPITSSTWPMGYCLGRFTGLLSGRSLSPISDFSTRYSMASLV